MHTDQLEVSPEQEDNTAAKIEKLDGWFHSLHEQLTFELQEHPIQVDKLVNVLVQLPISLRREYEHSISLRLSALRTESTTNGVMLHLSPLMNFIDYGLLSFLVHKFGSDHLKRDMRSYESEMLIFMKETTIKQLIDHLPGQIEIPPKFSIIEAKIGEDASKCTLERLNTIRRRYCPEVRLSEIVFHLVAVVESN